GVGRRLGSCDLPWSRRPGPRVRPPARTAGAAVSARRILERCDELSRLSEEQGLLTRWYGSASLVAAANAVARWMEEAGLSVRRGAGRKVVGRTGRGERD